MTRRILLDELEKERKRSELPPRGVRIESVNPLSEFELYAALRGTNERFQPATLHEISYDSLAGSSSESNSIARGARVSATTRGAGVSALIEVVAR